MARRRGSFRTVQRKSRDWGIGPGSTAVTTITSSSSAVLGGGVTPFGTQELTLARTRGLLRLFLTSASSVGDGYQGAFGIGKVALPAFTAGIASLPTPITEMDWDGWLFHSIIGAHRSDTGGTSQVGQLDVEVDSKAMRKFGGQEVLFAAIEVVEIGVAQLNVFFDSRMLFLLS